MVISKGMGLAAAVLAFGMVGIDDLAKGSPPTSVFPFTEAQTDMTDAAVVQNGALRRRAAENLRVLMSVKSPAGLGATGAAADGRVPDPTTGPA